MGLDVQIQPLETPRDINKGIKTIYTRDLDGNLYEFVQLSRGIYAKGGLKAVMRTLQDSMT